MFHARGAKLFGDLRREVDFIMRRANARTQLHNQLGRIRTEMFAHLLNRFRRDFLLGSFFSGMNKPDRRRFGIDNVNRAAIGNVNAERDFFLVRNQSVATGEFFVARRPKIDHCDFVAVNLLRGQQRPIDYPNLAARFAMSGVESFQHFGFVVRNIDAGNSLDKGVAANLDCGEGRKKFNRSLHTHEQN